MSQLDMRHSWTLRILWAVCAAWASWSTSAPWSAAALLPLDAERLQASVGGYAVMNCHLDFPFGIEIPYHLQWDKDGETIFSWYSESGTHGEDPGRTVDRWGGRVRPLGPSEAPAGLGRGSINLTSVRETDAGLYRCRVSFPNRSPPTRHNGTYYYLDVDGGNLIVTPPMNTTVVEGERAELECLPKSPEWEVEWFRDERVVSNIPELAARVERPRNGSLVLRHAVSADLGPYTCRVRAPDGAQQTASAFLDVHYKAKVVYAPKEKHFPYGKPASLDCHFSANPPLTNLRWEKDGFLFDPYNVPGVFYSRNGSLLFNKVDESHEGLYSCTAYNALGTAGASPAVRVRVRRPPALAARPPPLALARLGSALTLPCALVADPDHPPAVVHWTRKNSAELPVGRHSIVEGNLTLSEIREEDRGVYVCTASNEAAAVSAQSELLIENLPPRAPHQLSATATPHSLHLSWQPGDNGMDVEYTVWYRERASSEWRTMKILSLGVHSATLLGLRAGTEHEVRVLAQDALGDGLFSKPLFVRTLDKEEEGEISVTDEVLEMAAVVTEGAEDVQRLWSGQGREVEAEGMDDAESAGSVGEPLQVSVRLLEEGALVRWRRGGPPTGAHNRTHTLALDAPTATPCSLRWYADDALLLLEHTHLDYILVPSVEEGVRYEARVNCGAAGSGSGVVAVPASWRLRGAALGAAAAALLLAAAAASAYALRRRLRNKRDPLARPDKRRY